MQKIILSDNTEIEVQEGVSLSNIEVIKKNMEEIVALKDLLNKENNLNKVIFMQNSEKVAEYNDLVLLDPLFTIYELELNKIVLSFGLREKTNIEKKIDKIEKEQMVQDGAIADLGSVVGSSLI